MFSLTQAGLSAGVNDRSRTDGLADGSTVTITYLGAGTFRPRLLWVPMGDVGATATLSEGSPGVWTFQPTSGCPGSYRIQGIENEGSPNERRVDRIFGVRTVAGILIPAFGENCNTLASLENATATHVAQSTNNATDYSSSSLNAVPWSGWWRSWHELAATLDSLAGPIIPWQASYGPVAVPLNPAQPYHPMLTLPAPLTNATVIDYVVRVHAQQTSQPPLDSWDEAVVVRVSRDATNTSAVIVGGYRQFSDPHLRLSVSGTTVVVYNRSDNWVDWTYTAAAIVSIVPFDARRNSVHELPIGTGAFWQQVLQIPFAAREGEVYEVDYVVRGRYFTAGPDEWSFIRAKGSFALETNRGVTTLANNATVWSNVRIRVNWPGGGPFVNLEMEQHATQNWLADAEYTVKRIGD